MTKRELWLQFICDGKSERDSELLRRASEILEKNICEGQEYPWYPLRGIIPSQFTYKGLWNWDSAFHAVGVKYWDTELAYDQCRAFWQTQKPTGIFLDVWYANGGHAFEITKPPVFPWAFESVYRVAPNAECLKNAYEAYTFNESFWCNYRKRDGMFFYSSNTTPVNEAYAKCESGWDTSVRFDDGITNMWSVDLNCYMIMFYRSLGFMAREMGLVEDVKKWFEKEQKLTQLVTTKLWDSENGYFCDVYFEEEKSSGILSPASFMPLYIGIASKEQAEGMLKVFKEHFYPAMPTVAYTHERYTEDDYWRGPTWLNVAYFALKGLKNYGFTKEAEEGRNLLLDWCHNEKRNIFEYYNSKTGEGLGAMQFGWSAAFVIEFILNF